MDTTTNQNAGETKMAKEKVVKADVIRELITKNPEMKPQQIIELATAAHKGMKVTPQEVSTYKSKLRAAGAIPGKSGEDHGAGAVGTTGTTATVRAKKSVSLAPSLEKLEQVVASVGKEKVLELLKVL